MANKPIDSTPYRERNAPLPPWFRNWCLKNGKPDLSTATNTMNQWYEAFDIAQRFMKLPYGDAVQELNMLNPDMLFLVRARWDALRGKAIDWVSDES
jgi:hypothetical protein